MATGNFDITRKFVRVMRTLPNGLIEFEFAIGDPALCVELMLPESAFHEFCLANAVIVLDPATPGQGDWAARLNAASQQQISDAG